jgi:diaminopimelate epimerase
MVAFRKMHGLGNDFVVLDDRAGTLGVTPERARWLADRHRGIGADQVIVLEAPGAGADVFMRIRNPDGSEGGACGNATRCVAKLIAAETGKREITIRTIAGDLPSVLHADGRVTVDMGAARLGWREVPLAHECDTLAVPLTRPGLAAPAACSMGNPHATFFVDALDALDLRALGPSLERDPLFPDRANIGFAQVLSPTHLRLVVWERGAGLTLACGSGACATIVNAARRGLTGRRATVTMPGGDLQLEWRDDGHVLMTGPTALAFTGEVDLARIAA